MTVSARRFIVVPDISADEATVVSVTTDVDGSRQEAGRQVEQPTRSAATPPEGDISLILSGEPEAHVEGIAHITRGGVVEDARWGWVRDGDDTETDLQFRQSPHVVGRRMDCILQFRTDSAIVSGRPVRPRLHVLLSGDVLAVWTHRMWSPIWARQATTLATATEKTDLARLDHTTDTWGDPFNGPVPFDLNGASQFISAVDITQFPDTGEIVMCVATSKSMVPASTSPRALWVYISEDDGDTWVLRHRLFFDGDIPDIVLDVDGDGDVDDDTPIQDFALELLDSGRLCLLTVTEDYTWSLTSDDRGASWGVVLVSTHGAVNQYAGHGAGATKARNGMAVFTTALRRSTDPGVSRVSAWLTRDGVSFSAEIAAGPGASYFQTVDVTACVSPDGWVHVYGTEHAARESSEEGEPWLKQDWLWGRRSVLRDPTLSDTTETFVPSYTTNIGLPSAFHLADGSPDGSYVVDPTPADPCRYYGFTGLDAVLYRGQVLLGTVLLREGAQPVTDTQPDLNVYALMVYRLNHWQPIQERVNNAFGGATWTPEFPASGRIYNETWDCYDDPVSWSWTRVGAVPTFVAGGAEGGYMVVSGAPKYWHKAPSLNTDIGLSCNLRAVLHVETGGSLAADLIAIEVQLSDGVNGSNYSIRFQRNADDLKIALWDKIANAQVGSTITIDGTGWAEVLYAQNGQANGANTFPYLAARPYPRSTDPDWDEPYTLGVNGTTTATTATGAGTISWGHLQSGEPESWWKGVHLSRCDEQKWAALVQAGVDYIDNDGGSTTGANDRSTTGTGEPPLDNGLDNYMRTSRTLATPPMFMCRGVNARFRGEAVTEGDFDYTTGYAFAGRNVLIQPVMREWRSVDDEVKCDIVLRAPDNSPFRPDAMAVLGHNVSGVTISFNDTDSWGAPSVAIQLGIYGISGFTPDRYTHMWAFGPSGGWSFSITGCRLVVTGPGAETPWRQHQFRSDPGWSGQQFYVGIHESPGSQVYVFRVLDNTGTMLELATDPSDFGIVTGGETDYGFAIFSDRFAVMIGHHMDADPAVGYAYCRIRTRSDIHADTGRQFARIGRVVLGTAIEISSPDFERGWSVGFDDGSELVEQPTGAAYGHRRRPMLRTWSADRPWMTPPPEASAVFNSPSDVNERASWQQWVDAIRRLDGVDTACALIWEGARFVGMAGEERVQVCADPKDMAMCHVTGLGTMENMVYTGVTENLPGGDGCVPLPVSHIRGLTFRETL